MKEIQLTKGKVALVDDEDYEYLSQFKWFANKAKNGQFRAMKNKTDNSEFIYMHRMIMNVTDPNIWVDHKDREQLNNQKINLRLCNAQQSACNVKRSKTASNASKYRGVYWCIRDHKWRVFIYHSDKCTFLGRHENEEEAARVYNEAATMYQGEFAILNEFK